MIRTATLITLAVVIAAIGIVVAQEQGPRPGGGGGRGGMMMTPEIAQQLGLSAEQQKKIDDIRAQYGPKIQEATPETRREVFTKMREEVNAVLTEQQRTKWEELRAQMRGPGGGRPEGQPGAGPGPQGGPGMAPMPGMPPMPGGPGMMGGGGGEQQKEPVAKDADEKKILDVLAEMNQGQRGGMMNVSPADGRLIRMLVESTGAKMAVEIGTSNGYSGIWTCLALRKTGGKLITHDIDEGRAKLARENFKKAGVDGIVTLVMGDAHETVKKLEGPIDILFIDADKEGYGDYLKQLLPKVRPGGLILGHNTAMSRGSDDMGGFIKAITTDPALDTLFLNPGGQGMSLSIKKR
jgi:caffeoyl-CoA O-methyltransferase